MIEMWRTKFVVITASVLFFVAMCFCAVLLFPRAGDTAIVGEVLKKLSGPGCKLP